MFSTLAKQLVSDIFQHLPKSSDYSPEIRSQLKAQIEATLEKMNMVSRSEFDTQTAVLTRAQEKLELLTQQVDELEKRLDKE